MQHFRCAALSPGRAFCLRDKNGQAKVGIGVHAAPVAPCKEASVPGLKAVHSVQVRFALVCDCQVTGAVVLSRCYTVQSRDFVPTLIPALKLNSTVWLFDPAQQSPEPCLVPCSIVIAAVTNTRHYDSFLREGNLITYQVNPYTAEEAEEFFQLVGANISAGDLATRYFEVILHCVVAYLRDYQFGLCDQVGGSLLYLCDETRVQMARDAQRTALSRIRARGPTRTVGDGFMVLARTEGALCIRYNDKDPSNYEDYSTGIQIKPVSAAVESVLAKLCQEKDEGRVSAGTPGQDRSRSR
jgi:hypothetical protein